MIDAMPESPQRILTTDGDVMLPRNEEDKVITSSIIILTQYLLLNIVAERLEHRLKLTFHHQHADTAQSYSLFSRPLPAGEFGQIVWKFQQGNR